MPDTSQNFKACEIKVEGRVQGVGFRYSAIQTARRLHVTGWVRNDYNGAVSLFCEGPQDSVDRFIDWCRKGPPGAHVIDMQIVLRTYKNRYSSFTLDY